MEAKFFVAVGVLGSIIAIVTAMALARRRARRLRASRLAFIRDYAFPSELRRRINQQHPEWTFAQIDRVLDGLREYFTACLHAQSGRALAKSLGMPSRAVDDAWHAFIVMTRDYEAFCRSAFGRYLHHTPEAQMKVPMQDALANTLHFVRGGRAAPGAALAGAVAAGAAIPLLFALDRELGLANGHLYGDQDIADLEQHRRALLASQAGSDGAGGDSGGDASHGGHGHGGEGGHGGDGGGSCGGGGGCGGGCGSA